MDATVTVSASVSTWDTTQPSGWAHLSSREEGGVLSSGGKFLPFLLCWGKKQCDILVIINPEKKSNHSEGSMALSSDSQTS